MLDAMVMPRCNLEKTKGEAKAAATSQMALGIAGVDVNALLLARCWPDPAA